MNAPEGSAPAVVVEHATKRFVVPQERRNTLKERVLHPVRRSGSNSFEALRDVSFTVERGEFFGIVGRNGSGKSSLLKCLAGIYRLDGGRIYVNGRMSTFIELGVGFSPELAARDNVIMNGIMLGLSPREARERFDRVIEFAELEQFVDLKLKNYSSGMQVRLAFSVMIQIEADVLLVDEILAVGDAAFQQKCFDVFFRMRDEGRTVLFVTHDMAAVQRFCHRALLLERGRVVTIAAPREVADRYLDLNFATAEEGGGFGSPRAGDGAARVLGAWMEDEHGARQATLPQGSACSFRARVRFDEEVRDPSFAVAFVNPQHQNVFVASSGSDAAPSGHFAAGDTVEFGVSFDNALAPGRYAVSTLIARPDHRILDRWEGIFSFVVTGARAAGGLVDLAHDLELRRVESETLAGEAG
ncbi:MAG TPA: ABC transporter ATP-binding protein [Thermoleophilaceae bacterium]|nr:ABC transporter ATP-binding protein [Thermoleophilaceae bacterium]